MSRKAEPQSPLPGLEPPAATADQLERAVRRTIAALSADNLIEEQHAARLQLALELAQIVTIKRQTGRVSTVANDARVLMELLDKILPSDAGVDEALRKAMELWSEEVAKGEQGAAAGPA